MNPREALSGLVEVVLENKKIAGIVAGTVSAGVGAVLIGGNILGVPEQPQNVSVKDTTDKKPPPARTVKPLSPTTVLPTAETQRPSAQFTFNGVPWSTITVPGVYPKGCSTNQTANMMQDPKIGKLLRSVGVNPGDRVYMKEGAGRNNPNLAWSCQKGERVPNSAANPVVPGTWH